jgi:hypothetical protein
VIARLRSRLASQLRLGERRRIVGKRLRIRDVGPICWTARNPRPRWGHRTARPTSNHGTAADGSSAEICASSTYFRSANDCDRPAESSARRCSRRLWRARSTLQAPVERAPAERPGDRRTRLTRRSEAARGRHPGGKAAPRGRI